jgi:hypothetical protein
MGNTSSDEPLQYGSLVNIRASSSGKFLIMKQDSLHFQELEDNSKATRFILMSAAGSFGSPVKSGENIFLFCKNNHRYVVCESDSTARCNREAAYEWETFTIKSNSSILTANCSRLSLYCSNRRLYLSEGDPDQAKFVSVQKETELFDIFTVSKPAVKVTNESIVEPVKLDVERGLKQRKMAFVTHNGLLRANQHDSKFSMGQVDYFTLHLHPKNHRKVTISTTNGGFLHLVGEEFVQSTNNATRFTLIPLRDPVIEQFKESAEFNNSEVDVLDTTPSRFFLRVEQSLVQKPLFLSAHPNGVLRVSENSQSWEQILLLPETFIIEGQEYRTFGNLGAGSHGNVIAVENVKTGQKAAVKINSGNLTRARIEAENMKKYGGGCPHLPEVFGIDIDSPYRVIEVMSLVKGVTIKEFIAKHGNLSQEIAANLFVQTLRALNHLHNHQILFLDISQNNTMIEQIDHNKYHLTLVDFSSTMPFERPDSFTRGTSAVGGTSPYMPTEQFGGRFIVDRSTDIYSAAALFFYFIMGRTPFENGDCHAAHHKGIEQKYLDMINDIRLRNVLEKCLQVFWHDRYKTCDEVFEALGVN